MRTPYAPVGDLFSLLNNAKNELSHNLFNTETSTIIYWRVLACSPVLLF